MCPGTRRVEVKKAAPVRADRWDEVVGADDVESRESDGEGEGSSLGSGSEAGRGVGPASPVAVASVALRASDRSDGDGAGRAGGTGALRAGVAHCAGGRGGTMCHGQ